MKISTQNVRGKPRPVVDYVESGKRKRRFFPSRRAAEVWISARRQGDSSLAGSTADLPTQAKADLARAVREAAVGGVDILAAVREAIDRRGGAESPTLQAAIDALIVAKRAEGCRTQYVRDLERYCRMFAAGREAQQINRVTRQDIEIWFAHRSEKPTTKQGSLGRLGSLFSYAAAQRWIRESPVAGMKVRIDQVRPAIVTVEQARALLTVTRDRYPRMLPYLTLAMLAGIRPEEITRLSWADVDLDRGIVSITGRASKVRRLRYVHLEDSARAWLRLGGELPPRSRNNLKRTLRKIRAAAGVATWAQDILRHTAASMLLALHRDAARVALELGHSERTLFRHYRDLVAHEVAAEFWAILPTDVSDGTPPTTAGT